MHFATITINPEKESICYEVEMADLKGLPIPAIREWCAENTSILKGAANVTTNEEAKVKVEWCLTSKMDASPMIEKKLSNLNIILPVLSKSLSSWSEMSACA